MPIHKITLQVTVMCEADTLQEAVDAYGSMTLEQVHDHTNFGEDLGSKKIVGSETIDNPDKITEELLAVGNDGTFFDALLQRGEFQSL